MDSRSSISSHDYPILMAEDNQDDIIITQRAWIKGQIQNKLFIVNNGEEVIDFIFKKGSYTDVPTPAIMLLDLKMPKMDGFEVLELIKTSDQYKRIPIIVLTTSDREQDIQRAYDLGCNSYIVKPVNFESFIKAVIESHHFWLIQCKIP